VALLAAAFSHPHAKAQNAPTAPRSDVDPSGDFTLVSVGASLDHADQSLRVSLPGAASIRLSLEGSHLPRGSVLRVTSLQDGGCHILNAESLAQWGWTTAFFNGPEVEVRVEGSGTVRIPKAWAQFPTAGADGGFGQRSLCGPDSRLPVIDSAIARLEPQGCTAFIIHDLNGSLLSAGHCAPQSGSVVEFNVPPSSPDGARVHPPPEHQFAVEPTSVQMVFTGPGNDWSYFGVYPNPITGLTPFQAQGARYELANAPAPAPNESVTVRGYGSVAAPVPPSFNQTLKTDTGRFVSLAGTILRHEADTTNGNSGSPVYSVARNAVIAVHTHAGCSTTGGSNQATAVQNAPLQAALRTPRGVCNSGVGTGSSPLFAAGDLANNLGMLVGDQAGQVGPTFVFHTVLPPLVEGLAYDGIEDVFWAVTATGDLWRIAPDGEPQLTAVITGGLGVLNGLTGIAFDPSRRVLVAVQGSTGIVFDIDPETGAAIPLGAGVGGSIDALDFDPFTRTVFGLDDTPNGTALVRLDRNTGAITRIGMLGPGLTDCNGLAFNPSDGFLYTVNTAGRQVLQINPQTGAAASLGVSNGYWDTSVGLAARVPLPTCIADVDFSGATDSDDIVRFFQWWELADPAADVSRNGAIDSDDVVGFFGAWDSGCQ